MAIRIDWQPGDVFLDHYRVERLLGVGGMGKVYRVLHRGWGIPLVVKVPRSELVDDVTHMLSFERECETWTALGHHPNIVSCYFVRRYEGIPLVFAEYAAFGSLHDWISSGRLYQGSPPRVLARMLDFAIQFAQGLAYAHQHGVVHQDVKPANVMIGAEFAAKVTDFGLARAHAAVGTGRGKNQPEGVTAGGMTPAYCSPEQAANGRLTAKSDLWSWAVSVMEMFTHGCHWMSGVAARDVLKEHVRQQRGEDRHGEKIPPELGLFLDTCFRSEPERRPASMEAAVRELVDIYTSATGAMYPRFLEAPAQDPADPAAIANANNRAISTIELGQTDAAMELLKETELNARAFGDLNAGPELQDLAYNQALLQIRTNPVYNVDYVPSLIPKRPDELRQEFLVGLLFLEAGKVPEAIDRLTRPAQRASAFQGDALNARGIALLLGGETAPAMRSFEAALELKPEQLEFVRNLAIARYYHGDIYGALALFQRLSSEQRLDAVDAIRFAAVLSSSGQVARANEFLGYLRVTGSPSAATLCTASEVGFGVQSFLPDLVPAGDDFEECGRWALEALAREPDNLRAEILRQRLPDRVVLRPDVPLKRGRRVPPDPNDPEELADRVAASYEPAAAGSRWGRLDAGEGLPVRVLSTAFPIVLGLILGALLFQSERLIEVFGADSFGVRAGCWMTLVAATAFIVLRRAATHSASHAAALYCIVLPAAIVFPTLAHEALVAARAIGQTGAAGPEALLRFSAWSALVLVALLLARELPFRLLGSRIRAWGGYSSPASGTSDRTESPSQSTTGITAIARVTRGTQQAGALGYSAQRVTSRLRYWFDRAATWHLRISPRVQAALLKYRSHSGGWHVLLMPQFVALAVADAAWVALVPDAPTGLYALVMIAGQLLFWALIPLFPRAFVLSNFILAPMVAWAFATRVMWGSAHTVGWTLAFALVLLALTGLAWRRCPAFAAAWQAIPPSQWNVQTLIDPLDMRRYAASWRLIPVTNPVQKL